MAIQQMFLGASGATAETYWFTAIGTTDTDSMQINDKDTIAVHTDGSVYSGCYRDNGGDGNRKSYLVKLDKDGAVSWQRTVASDARSDNGSGLQVDSAGNVYHCGSKSASDGDGQWLHKFNSSGTIQWQRRLYGDKDDKPRDIVFDSSDNVYVVGEQEFSGESNTKQGLIAKYNSSGTLQWQKRMYWLLSDRQFKNQFQADVDSNDNIYVAGSLWRSGYYEQGALLKMEDDGTKVWTRKQEMSTGNTYTYGVVVDSSDNVIISSYKSGDNWTMLVKYNSSGTELWKRQLGASSSDSFTRLERVSCLAVDTDDSIYGIAKCNGTGTGDWTCLMKWNSSGTLQWQQRIRKERNDDWNSTTAFNPESLRLAVLDNHSVYFSFRIGSINNVNRESLVVAKLPANEVLDGNHGDFTIAETTFTYGTQDSALVTNNDVNLTVGSSSMSTNTPNYTVATVTYSNAKTDVE